LKQFLNQRTFLILIFISACSSVKKIAVQNDIITIVNQSEIFSDHFTGLSILDATSNEFLVNYNAEKYFTPASTLKLYTLYVALKTLSDSIPSAFIENHSDSSVSIEFIGDPTFLNPIFPEQHVLEYISQFQKINLIGNPKLINRYGTGWAWDDFDEAYQAEISYTPIYGNLVHISNKGDLTIEPNFFQNFVSISDTIITKKRSEFFNSFDSEIENKSDKIPFITSDELFIKLLSDTIGVGVRSHQQLLNYSDTLFSYPTDEVLSGLMKQSDNFLAEQLLLLCSRLNEFESIKEMIDYAKINWFSDHDDFRWVDGSGLSRYNLTQPISQVRLLKKLINEFGKERIQEILPTGGQGTLKNLYMSDSVNYIWAKTGTLSNNHNLSGYLLTKQGKFLLFSFMNNHYLNETEEVKKEIESLIQKIRDAY